MLAAGAAETVEQIARNVIAALHGDFLDGVRHVLDRDGRGSLTDQASRQSPEFHDVERGEDDLAAILYTSGTTGRSKGAMLSHENLASNARVLVDQWRFTPSDVLIHALPIFHTHGLFVAINVALFAGASLIFMERFDPAAIVAALPRATTLMGVPTFYVRLLREAGLTAEATRHMRLFVSGSAPLLPETFKAWQERTGLVRVRLGAAVAGNLQGLAGEDRPHHSRAL
eukprot:gene827-1122_t